MEREKAKHTLVATAIAALAAVEVVQAVYTHRLAERFRSNTAGPVISLSARPVAMRFSPWNHPFAYLQQVQSALGQEERTMARAVALWPAPLMVGLPALPPAGAAETVSLQVQPSQYVVRAKLPPGVGAKQVKVKLVGRQLSLDTELSGQAKSHDGRAAQSYSSAYMESFTLPGPVVDTAMKEHFKEGMLSITIPRASAPKVAV